MKAGSDAPNRQIIRVLIADDSAFVRSVLKTILDPEPRIEVIGTARDGREALAAFEKLRPDLVLLDVEMPEMDGLQVLAQIRKQDRKTPVIMCSTLTQRGVRITIDALALGATDYVSKRGGHSLLDQQTPSLEQQLVPKILALFPENRPFAAAIQEPHGWMQSSSAPSAHALDIVVIGVSTGGPAALEEILPRIPESFPLPILIVQHMPQRFTEQLAIRLDSLCPLRVCEAVDRRRPEPGVITIARGDWHLELTRDFRMRLHQEDIQSFCRPSVDLLFQSASIACGGRLLGVVLTGMGSDGLEGCRAIRNSGGSVLAQDSGSSVVWGMPGSVAHAGLANKILPLSSIAAEIIRLVSIAAPEKRPAGVA